MAGYCLSAHQNFNRTLPDITSRNSPYPRMDRYDAYVSPRCRYPSRPPEHILNSLRPEHRTLVALPLALDPLVSALPNKQCTKYLVNLKQSKAPYWITVGTEPRPHM